MSGLVLSREKWAEPVLPECDTEMKRRLGEVPAVTEESLG